MAIGLISSEARVSAMVKNSMWAAVGRAGGDADQAIENVRRVVRVPGQIARNKVSRKERGDQSVGNEADRDTTHTHTDTDEQTHT